LAINLENQVDISSLPRWAQKMYNEAWDEAKKRANLSLLAVYQRDPVRFGNEVLGHHYYSDVENVMRSIVDNPITIAKSGTGVGKSFASADVAIWWFSVYEDAEVYITAAPPLENLKNILWGELLYTVRHQPDLFKKFTIKELEIKRHDKSAIHGVTIPMTGTSEERVAKFCMDADDLFEMHDGSFVRFGDLIDKNTVPVISVNESFQRSWSQAEFFDNGIQLMYELTFDDGDIIRRTGNHPLYAGWNIRPDGLQAGNSRHKRGRYRVCDEGWLNVSDLCEGHAILCPDSTDFNFGNEEADENRIKFLAYMIGDGCFKNSKGSGKTNRLQFTQSRNAQLKDFLFTLDSMGIKYNVSDKKKYNWVCISINNPTLMDFIKQCDLHEKGSADKFIPSFVFQLKREQIALFLHHLFSTDGWACFTNKAEIGYASKSSRLVYDIQRLLRRFGIHAKVLSKIAHWNHKGEERSGVYWSLFINHSIDVIRFAEQIGIYGKEDALEVCYEYAMNAQWVRGNWKFEKPGYRWKKITSIRVVGNKPAVGIHVPINNTFLTSLVEHNSGKHAPHLLFLVDEADAVPPEVFEGIEGCMSGGMARLLGMFNPKAQMGPIFQMEMDQKARFVNLSALRHPNVVTGEDVIPGAVTRETVVRRINQWTRPIVEGEEPTAARRFEIPDFLVGTVAMSLQGIPYPPLEPGVRFIMESAFSYMVLGQYPEQGENQLISVEWIKAARGRWDAYVAEHGEKPPNMRPRLGLDVAEFGQDFNAPVFRYGNFVPRIERIWQGVDPTVSGEKAAELCRTHNVDVLLVDGTGYGSSIAPQISKLVKGVMCISVKVAGKPSPMITSELGEFFQIRDQMWWACREWLREEEAMLPPEPMLLEELMTPTYRIDDRGKIHLSSKDDLREKLKRSSNYADALVLTFVEASRAKVVMLSE
jgi:intein/homing endonuclease